MKRLLRLRLASLLCAGLACAPLPARADAPLPGAAPIDLLDTPAPMTPRAAQQLMTALTRAGDRLVAVGARGTILYSDDGGGTWTQARVPVAVMLTGVHFPTPQLGWAVGHDGVILHSRDGGEHWQRQFDGNHANTLQLAAAQARLASTQAALAALDEQDEREVRDDPAAPARREAAETALMHAEDSLAGVEQAREFGPSRALLNVWFADARTGYAVGAFGMGFVTRDGGESWQLFGDALPNPEELHLYAIAPAGDGVLLIAGERGTLFRSVDGGGAWQRIDELAEGGLYGLLALPQAHGVRMLAYGFGGTVLGSDDGGQSWQDADSDNGSALYGGAVHDGTVVLVGQNGVVVSSRDGGRHFVSRPSDDGRLLTAALAQAPHWLLAGWGGVAAGPAEAELQSQNAIAVSPAEALAVTWTQEAHHVVAR